ncbi:hypothetical protein [Elizabethkingia bruuniana]|uniref:Uncharacterized protein n=1 Tax=Elizabethkingia bruuniana TaxID=1756149 RepID=A0A7T7V2J4_9FLAO|nr:hypothetical protein [Elizabethkingia bruuniana]KGO08204.1 hypothetical protein KS04_20475 [Elizabethkingia miricola]AQX86984.1 hypothetical protein AYC65_19095 [Elizabethkingia bruuniana]KUY26770.1 hypothetical protein ATB97_04495 [Elizabethkingia bruuniana]OPB66788.1 hypothetical protein BAY12_04655 [Elizabethkingia bruuniana]QQN60713.1 hypothetical protein I6H88_09125 [Elizabethkingia bruuniana]
MAKTKKRISDKNIVPVSYLNMISGRKYPVWNSHTVEIVDKLSQHQKILGISRSELIFYSPNIVDKHVETAPFVDKKQHYSVNKN